MSLVAEVEKYHEDKREFKVACAKCRAWVANARAEDLRLPLRGSMFERRAGCEAWEMPEPDATGMGLVCPHSVTGDSMDLHLFIPHIAGRELEANELYIHQSNEIFIVEKLEEPEPELDLELCACGCEREAVRDHVSGNRYATLGCHTKWVYQQEE